MADTIDIAAQTAQAAGHTVGDAIGAYQMTQQLQQQKQQMDQAKQKNDMDKATHFTDQINAMNQHTGPARQAIGDNLLKTLPMMYPNANPDTIKMIMKDPEISQGTGLILQRITKGQGTPDDFQQIPSLLSSLPDKVSNFVKEAMQSNAMIEGNRLKQQGMEGRVQNGQDTIVGQVMKQWDDNPNLKQLLNVGQPLGRDVYNFSEAKRTGQPITNQMVHEAIISTGNALAPGSGVSDSRIKSITPYVNSESQNAIMTAFTNDPNRPAAPGLIKYATDLQNRVYKATQAEVSMNADRQAAGVTPTSFNSREAYNMHMAKYNYYKSGKALLPPDASTMGALPPLPNASPPPPQAAAPSQVKPPPKQGDVQYDPSSGKTYKVIGDHWVEQK